MHHENHRFHWREKQDNPFEALDDVRAKQNALIISYLADMAKHSGKVNALHLQRLWKSIPSQLAQSDDDSSKRFQFKDVVPGANRYSQLISVIDWLEAAGLILKVKIANTAKSPLSAFTKAQQFIGSGCSSLYAWQEKTAEIEFLRELDDLIIPIEVKSGVQTKAKSLSVFREKYHPPYEVLFSAKNLSVNAEKKKWYLPLYMANWFPFK